MRLRREDHQYGKKEEDVNTPAGRKVSSHLIPSVDIPVGQVRRPGIEETEGCDLLTIEFFANQIAFSFASANQPPVFTKEMENQVVSESKAIGSVIFTLQGTDPEGSDVKYGLLGTDKLTVNPRTGEVTLVRPLDREGDDGIIIGRTQKAFWCVLSGGSAVQLSNGFGMAPHAGKQEILNCHVKKRFLIPREATACNSVGRKLSHPPP
ncbi:unnamed protein product [Cyprideis torosa]|uniref:Uncharacterized protein n=1 Tax=Cyprideis torosa TaxID=163714 RepID=A0A7R8W2B2_9CRUS|nr:unnamed protein product [Cyprideis torosa]CAG0880820.1 unnamed protein product [Cyprideis torosa]